MKRKGDIAYSSDVIRETAKELGISEEKAAHVLEFSIAYIKKLSVLPEVFSIYLPELGQLYLSACHLKNVIINLSLKQRTESEEKKMNSTAEKLELLNQSLNPGYSPHKKRSKIRNNYFSTGKSLKELETFQNNYDGN